MTYYCIQHFLDEPDAYKRFDELVNSELFKDLKEEKRKGFKRYASSNGHWLALKDGTDVLNLIAAVDKDPINNYTCIDYEAANENSIENQGSLNRFKVKSKAGENDKKMELIARITAFSNYNFLIEKFCEWSLESDKEIVDVEHKIKEKYHWEVPEDVTEEYLHNLESFLDVCGRNCSKIELNYNLARTHCKNIRINGLDVDINPIHRNIDTIKLKLSNAKVTYGRIKDMKDIALGKIEIRNMMVSNKIQEDMLKRQKDAMTIEHASWIIEGIVVFYYTINIWERINPAGYEQTSLLLRYAVGIIMALGVFLIFEAYKDYRLKKAVKDKYRYYLLFSIVFLASGLVMINI
jgi:hypothetical protein